MAYRIRNYDNLSVHQIDEIFRRGRGLGRNVVPAGGAEDFSDIELGPNRESRFNPMPPAEVIDEELELVR